MGWPVRGSKGAAELPARRDCVSSMSLFHGFQQVGGLGKNGKGGLLAVKII